MKTIPIVLLVMVFASHAVPQSGRRVNTTRTVPIAPVQPPANPEPELAPPPRPASPTLAFLPEKVLERRIKTLDNKSFRLADFHGKVMVINLWASWCGPCRREVPDYDRVRKEYAGREVAFVGLTVDDTVDAAKVNRFVRETGFGFLLGWADDELARVLMSGRRSIPQTIVIDTNGAVISHWDGYARGYNVSRLKEAIDSALK